MFRRWKQEKDEGKQATDPGVRLSYFMEFTGWCLCAPHPRQVSAEMKALNSRFAKLHGVSSLANMYAVVGLVFHGLWIANNGLGSL